MEINGREKGGKKRERKEERRKEERKGREKRAVEIKLRGREEEKKRKWRGGNGCVVGRQRELAVTLARR